MYLLFNITSTVSYFYINLEYVKENKKVPRARALGGFWQSEFHRKTTLPLMLNASDILYGFR